MVRAQLWYAPAATAATPRPSPLTPTGTLLSVLLPLPSCPLLSRPQHLVAPRLFTPQACSPPTAMLARAAMLASAKAQAAPMETEPMETLSYGPPTRRVLP